MFSMPSESLTGADTTTLRIEPFRYCSNFILQMHCVVLLSTSREHIALTQQTGKRAGDAQVAWQLPAHLVKNLPVHSKIISTFCSAQGTWSRDRASASSPLVCRISTVFSPPVPRNNLCQKWQCAVQVQYVESAVRCKPGSTSPAEGPLVKSIQL